LIHAYLRNNKSGLKLPTLAFLHGNVSIGYCEKDKTAGVAGMKCTKCGLPYTRSPLLFPIKKKNYTENTFISNQWKILKKGFQNAFMITIFGYSGPKTDVEAISAMQEAWGHQDDRRLEQTTFITTQSEESVHKNWQSFIHSHHYEVNHDFYDSWIANHPRRTGEAYWNQYREAKFIDHNPIPRNLDFQELWKWYDQFKKAEDKV
ncbi:MAG: hypothetical protein ABI340_00620, partial [Nitrososphaera sp.]